MKKYKVRIPYHSYTEQIVESDNEEQAETFAAATDYEEQQLLDNAIQDGQIEAEQLITNSG